MIIRDFPDFSEIYPGSPACQFHQTCVFFFFLPFLFFSFFLLLERGKERGGGGGGEGGEGVRALRFPRGFFVYNQSIC